MESGESVVNVMVTGGGAYDEFDFNTAADIRDLLPSVIAHPGKPIIKIYRYPVDTPCTYEFGIQAMDAIWSGRAVGAGETTPLERVDLALHMGMRPSYPGYCLETRARKLGYKDVGEDGNPFPVEMVEAGGPWAKLPDYLHSDFNMEATKNSLSTQIKDLDIIVSQNAGGYFCEFELWSSLANAYLKDRSGNAIFLHVPKDRSANSIEKGAKVAVAVIEAAAEEIHGRRNPRQ